MTVEIAASFDFQSGDNPQRRAEFLLDLGMLAKRYGVDVRYPQSADTASEFIPAASLDWSPMVAFHPDYFELPPDSQANAVQMATLLTDAFGFVTVRDLHVAGWSTLRGTELEGCIEPITKHMLLLSGGVPWPEFINPESAALVCDSLTQIPLRRLIPLPPSMPSYSVADFIGDRRHLRLPPTLYSDPASVQIVRTFTNRFNQLKRMMA